MASKVGARYQLVIDPEVRERLGVKPGWVAVQTVVGGRLEVVFLPPEHDSSLAGSLHEYARGRPPITDWQDVKREAWEAHVDERWGPPRSTD
jgi:bifunctional DNA-binding transcriptional regulator/antitoxin component of YhaV-PrlF toxin-antitoxin module